MRSKLPNYEQLVNENKRALLNDEEQLKQIELRMERRQEKLVEAKRKKQLAIS